RISLGEALKIFDDLSGTALKQFMNINGGRWGRQSGSIHACLNPCWLVGAPLAGINNKQKSPSLKTMHLPKAAIASSHPPPLTTAQSASQPLRALPGNARSKTCRAHIEPDSLPARSARPRFRRESAPAR